MEEKRKTTLDEFMKEWGSTKLHQRVLEFYLAEGVLAEPLPQKLQFSPYVTNQLSNMRRIQDEAERELAAFFEAYTFFTVYGEVGYAPDQAKSAENGENVKTPAWLKNRVGKKSVNRTTAWTVGWDIYMKGRLTTRIKKLCEMVNILQECTWSKSFGGKKWGVIAQNLQDYWYDKKSRKLFVDTAVSLAHNGCLYVDKLFNTAGNESMFSVFKNILDEKYNAPDVFHLFIAGKKRLENYDGIAFKDILVKLDNKFADFIEYLRGECGK